MEMGNVSMRQRPHQEKKNTEVDQFNVSLTQRENPATEGVLHLTPEQTCVLVS